MKISTQEFAHTVEKLLKKLKKHEANEDLSLITILVLKLGINAFFKENNLNEEEIFARYEEIGPHLFCECEQD
jgi:hypothetical protein